MEADILQQFLSLGLIDVEGDDTRLEKLRQAASEMQQRFADQPRLGLYHAMMVYSPNVDVDDACFGEDAQALLKQWETYTNRHPDPPREIFRAISLQGVMGAAENSPALRAAVTYGLRSLEQHPTTNKEGVLLRDLYQRLEATTETEAVAIWRLDASAIERAFASVAISAPQAKKGEPTSPETIVDSVAAETNRIITALATDTTTALKKQSDKVREIATSVAQRSDLLWWKESMYSLSLGTSYRDVPAAVAAIFMAIDLHRQVGPLTPRSVDYFLRETVREKLVESASLTWNDVVKQIASGGYTKQLVANMPVVPPRAIVRTIAETLLDHAQHGEGLAGKRNKPVPKGGKASQVDLSQLAVRVHLALQALRNVIGTANGTKV